MKNKKNVLLIIMSVMIISFSAYILVQAGEENPDKVIGKLYKAIDAAEEDGVYQCCIDPPCTMCYLGKWIYEKGTCYCDKAIAEGRLDDVCPECKNSDSGGICASPNLEYEK